MMTTTEILTYLQKDIHSTVFATVDEKGLPQTCVIDLRQNPVYRQSFAYGGAAIHEAGYQIDKSRCIGCQGCRSVCPAQCISKEVPREIDHSRCLHCGNCFRICPVKAVRKVEEIA